MAGIEKPKNLDGVGVVDLAKDPYAAGSLTRSTTQGIGGEDALGSILWFCFAKLSLQASFDPAKACLPNGFVLHGQFHRTGRTGRGRRLVA